MCRYWTGETKYARTLTEKEICFYVVGFHRGLLFPRNFQDFEMLAQERGCLVQKESVYMNLLCNQYLFSQCKNITAPTEPVIFRWRFFKKCISSSPTQTSLFLIKSSPLKHKWCQIQTLWIQPQNPDSELLVS